MSITATDVPASNPVDLAAQQWAAKPCPAAIQSATRRDWDIHTRGRAEVTSQ